MALDDDTVKPFHHFQDPVSYDEFEQYMKLNMPCTFGSWISQHWPSRQKWVTNENYPNFAYLKEKFSDCSASVSRFVDDTSFDCFDSSIGKFLEYWEDLTVPSECPEFPASNFQNLPHYLKDWHFAKETNPDSVYQVPTVFADDWLNTYWKSRDDVQDDYKFSYFGPAGSYTPFHADVFRSYSWSVNVCGGKKWLILYPDEEKKLDKHCLNVQKQCIEKGLRYRIIHQGEGEGIFVPSGWFHQVLNTRDTISINHNWCNFHTIPRMWNYLLTEIILVEREISDCKELMSATEWDDQCQLILRANIGMGFTEFFKLIIVNLLILFPDEDLVIQNRQNFNRLLEYDLMSHKNDIVTSYKGHDVIQFIVNDLSLNNMTLYQAVGLGVDCLSCQLTRK